MMIHYDRDRWVIRCDGRLEDGSQCPFAVSGRTAEETAGLAREQGMTLLGGGRWACLHTETHKRGVM